MQGILDNQSFRVLVPGLTLQPTLELEALQKQENDYLDGFLNLQHYSEIYLTKKRKMDNDTAGTHRKEMELMGSKLRKLKDTIATLTALNEADETANSQQMQWEKEMSNKIDWMEAKEQQHEDQSNQIETFMQQILTMMKPQMG